MKGHPNQELLALYAGGDLALNQEDAKHVDVCPACQNVLADLRETRELLLGTALPEPSALDLLSVRRGLNQRIQHLERRRPRWWMPAAAVLAAALIVTVAVNHHHQPPALKELTPPIQRPAVAAIPPTLPVVKAIPVRRRTHPCVGIRSVTLLARQDGPSQLKLTTADPNIVILLQMKEEVNNQ